MTFGKEIKKKVNWNIVNSCLVIAIIAIVFLNFYKKEISCNCGYDDLGGLAWQDHLRIDGFIGHLPEIITFFRVPI